MKRIGITANPEIRELKDILSPMISTIEGEGVDVVLEDSISHIVDSAGMTLKNMEGDGLDVLITVGGDGTVLRALHHINVPILGVNMGRVGFLNELEPENVKGAITRVLEGDYKVDVHDRLCVKINGERMPPVLNEVVVHSAQALKIREFELYLDGNLLDKIRSDGVIVATPTGSTGYALSAGGPLLDLGLNGFLILPLLPFRIAKRPNVVPMSSCLEIRIIGMKSCIAVLDGQIEMQINGNDRIEVMKAKEPAKFLRIAKNPYDIRRRTFEKLMSK